MIRVRRCPEPLNRLLEEHFCTRPTQEWIEALEAADIFCAPVYNYEQLAADPQVQANGYLATMEHPQLGPTQVVNSPIQFSETPAAIRGPEPQLGQHTEEVLLRFGHSPAEIAELREAGVV